MRSPRFNPYRGESLELLKPISVKDLPCEWVNLIATVILPWLCFTFLVALFCFTDMEYAHLNWALAAVCVLLAVLFLMLGVTHCRMAHIFLGILILVSVSVGVPIGLSIRAYYMIEFWRMDDGAHYAHVDPSDPGNVRSDAVFLDFAEGTFVDVQKTVGYMQGGTVYCAAPVLGLQQSQRPAYWVVGKDCCGMRGDFACDSANDERASSGVVAGPKDAGMYANAVKMAQSLYGLDAITPVFLHWTTDIQAHKNYTYSRAAEFVVISSVVHIILFSLGVTLYIVRFKGKQIEDFAGLKAMFARRQPDPSSD